MNSKEKFLSLVSDEDTNTLGHIEERIAHRDSRRMAFDIALKILERLDQLGWSQKRLAEELGVSPQLVNKWVRGKENFTIETLAKIGKTLNTSFIEVSPFTIGKSVSPASSRPKSNTDSVPNEKMFSLKKKLSSNTPDKYHSFIHSDTLHIAAEPTPAYASKVNSAIARGAIDFLVSSVTVHQIKVSETAIADETELDIHIEIGYGLLKEQHAISCGLNYEIIAAENPFLKCKLTCVYTVEPTDWNTMINHSQFTIPSSFARHLGMMTSGIALGVLHEIIENSIFKAYALPLINTDDLPDEDIIFAS